MAESQPIRVLIVDDHPVVRTGLKFSLLSFDDIVLAGEASSGEEAVELCAASHPDVVLMDLKMPGMDGVSATRAVRERCPGVQVIALTSFREGDLVRQALQAGATGYLLKGVTMEDLATAIRSAYTGRPILSPEALQALTLSTRQAPEIGQDLTDRQLEVLALMVDGLSNAEIAVRLTITVSTARFHVSSILRKLGAANRAEATALAVKHRLLV